jgi:hypothetical protein
MVKKLVDGSGAQKRKIVLPKSSAQQAFDIGGAVNTVVGGAVRIAGAALVGGGTLIATRSVPAAAGAATGFLVGSDILSPQKVTAPNRRRTTRSGGR